MAYEILNDEITVTIGENDKKESFTFRVPSPRGMAKIGQRAATLRSEDAPEAGGTVAGLDGYTLDLYDAFAIMETHLARADAKDNWPFSPDDDGKPAVLSAKFPTSALKKVREVRRGFYDALATFLE